MDFLCRKPGVHGYLPYWHVAFFHFSGNFFYAFLSVVSVVVLIANALPPLLLQDQFQG